MLNEPRSIREKLEYRLEELRAVRQTWDPTWIDISEQTIPYKTAIMRSAWAKKNRGDKRDQKIYNNTPVRAVRTLTAGMMAGITNPTREWFELTVEDPSLADRQDVRRWLDDVQRLLLQSFQESNWYDTLVQAIYPALATVGVCAVFQEEDEATGLITYHPKKLGTYYLDVDHNDQVDTYMSEESWTTRQLKAKFAQPGDRLSHKVEQAWRDRQFNQRFDVVHAVVPNEEYEPGRIGAEGKRWLSVWYEKNLPAKKQEDGGLLRVSGYEEFPVLAPRWSAEPGDAYGHGPGWDARGDCRVLQLRERRGMALVDKLADPPMRARGNVKRASLLPGDTTILGRDQSSVFEPAIDMPALASGLNVTEQSIARIEQRIEQTYHVDLWRFLLNDDRAQRATATEIEAVRQEVMLQLGPVLQAMDNELLEPAVNRAYMMKERAGEVPEPPAAMVGSTVTVRFISILHQVQKTTGLGSVRTLLAEAGQFAQLVPDALDNIDGDAVMKELARMTAVPPKLMRDEEQVEQLRQARAEQEQAQQQGASMLAATQGAKNLGQTDPDNLQAVMERVGPVAGGMAGADSIAESLQ